MIRIARTETGSRGFTLVEVVVVLFIIGVLLAMAAAITRGVAAAQKRSTTATRIATVEAALAQFVMQQKRLPCPANGTLPSTDNNAGLELRAAGACTGTQANGVVPWRTLALSDVEASDGWDRRFTYRLDVRLALDGGMNMSWCDPAGTENTGVTPRACNVACTSTTMASCTPPEHFLRGLGLQVRNAAGTVLMSPETASATPPTAAAYVVISHGETGGGGYNNMGILSASNITDGTEEMKNYATVPYVNNTVTYLVDSGLNETSGADHFDDVVARPSIMTVANKAGLGPRTH